MLPVSCLTAKNEETLCASLSLFEEKLRFVPSFFLSNQNLRFDL